GRACGGRRGCSRRGSRSGDVFGALAAGTEVGGVLNVRLRLGTDAHELLLGACDFRAGVLGYGVARLERVVLELARVAREALELAVERLPHRVEKVDGVVAGMRVSAAALVLCT